MLRRLTGGGTFHHRSEPSDERAEGVHLGFLAAFVAVAVLVAPQSVAVQERLVSLSRLSMSAPVLHQRTKWPSRCLWSRREATASSFSLSAVQRERLVGGDGFELHGWRCGTRICRRAE